MSPTDLDVQRQQQEQVLQFMGQLFGLTAGEFRRLGQPPSGLGFSAAMPLRNEPELWADVPWRIEPGQDVLPLLFVIRDGNVQPPGKGPWRLHELRVEQRRWDGTWHAVCTLPPAALPGVSAQGSIAASFWTHRIAIPLTPSTSPCRLYLDEVRRGGPPLHLRVVFASSFPPDAEIKEPAVHLETTLAARGLPQGRAEAPPGPRHWFYGDIHYHSAYTNDVKEFGGPLLDSRAAGLCIGLDWLAVTDHSCDLDDPDVPGGPSRWLQLKTELARPEISDGDFRCLLGEEVTLRGGDGDHYVHMLALGALDELLPGGFLPDDGGSFVTKAYKEVFEAAMAYVAEEGGYPSDMAARLFGPVWRLGDVLDALPAGAVAFAAHPYAVAQPPFLKGKWAPEDLDDLRLVGLEFWNGRARRTALLTDNPYDQVLWSDPGLAAGRDQERIEKLREHVEKDWDGALMRGVREWQPHQERPARRPVLVAGCDAHGSFCYSVGWGWSYEGQAMIEDNALGRARTAVHLPDHAAPGVPEGPALVAALKRGACLVTDGPLLELSLTQGGRRAHLGDVLLVEGEGEVELTVAAHSSPEFGPVERVYVMTYFDGQAGTTPWRRTVPAGKSRRVNLRGRQGFLRVEAETVGPDGERFCCFTNPIWLRRVSGVGVPLRARLVSKGA